MALSPHTLQNRRGQILHVVEGYSCGNGLTTVIWYLSRFLLQERWPRGILTVGPVEARVEAGVQGVEFPLVPVHATWRYPQKMAACLRDHQEDFKNEGTIFYLHGMWGAPLGQAPRSAGRSLS